jgi:hypothetical protein
MGLTTRKPETIFDEMLNTIVDSLSDLASSDKEVDGEIKDDDEADTKQRDGRADDEPAWVMVTLPKTALYRMASNQQKRKKLDKMI